MPISDGLKNGQKVPQVGGNTPNIPKGGPTLGGNTPNTPRPAKSNTPGGNYWPGVGSSGMSGK